MGRKNKFTLEKRVSMCKDYLERGLGGKEKIMAIAKECIDNGKNYKETCIKYGIKYSNLYSWVSKYQDNIMKSSNYSEEDKYKMKLNLHMVERE